MVAEIVLYAVLLLTKPKAEAVTPMDEYFIDQQITELRVKSYHRIYIENWGKG